MYEEIADDLRRRLRGGEFPVGTLLPGISALQQVYPVGLNTIRAAEDLLRQEGLLRITQGRGAEVIALPPEDPMEVLAEIKKLVVRLEGMLTSEPSAIVG